MLIDIPEEAFEDIELALLLVEVLENLLEIEFLCVHAYNITIIAMANRF